MRRFPPRAKSNSLPPCACGDRQRRDRIEKALDRRKLFLEHPCPVTQPERCPLGHAHQGMDDGVSHGADAAGRCDRGSGTAQRTSGASFLPVQPPPGWFKRKGGSSGPELIMTSGQTVPAGRSLRKPVRKPRSANWQEPGRIPPGDAGLWCRRDLRARTDVP